MSKENIDSTTSPYFTIVTNPNDSIEIQYNGIANPLCGPPCWTDYQGQLITYAHQNGVKVLIDVHAVHPAGLNFVAADSVRTDVFVDAVVSYCERKGYDGVEIDWEGWQAPIAPRDDVSRLTRRFRARLDRMNPSGILVYAPGIFDTDTYDTAFDAMIDQYNLQMYGYGQVWNPTVQSNSVWWNAPLRRGADCPGSEAKAYDTQGPLQWIAGGHDRLKMGIGIPSFGYVYKGQDQLCVAIDQRAGYSKYQEVTSLVYNGGTKGWDDVVKESYITGIALYDQGIPGSYEKFGVSAGMKFFATYEDSQSIMEKVNWARGQGFGGFMMYDLTMDLDGSRPFGERNPLHNAVVTALGHEPLPPPVPVLSSPSDSAIGVGTDPILSWNASIVATSYRLQVSTDSTFSSSLIDKNGIGAASYNLTSLSYNTTYYWRLNATNAVGASHWSTVWSFTTVAAPAPSIIVSDDFSSFTLNTDRWTFINPLGDATLTMTGTNTQDARVSIFVPAGAPHDVWSGGNYAPRIMQPANNTDFEVEARFESPLTAGHQFQGILVQADSMNYIRFDFVTDGSTTNIFAATFLD
ncbi:MAG: glycosyl hydrolase family 18 protein, partial [Bacteroidota bacterium]